MTWRFDPLIYANTTVQKRRSILRRIIEKRGLSESIKQLTYLKNLYKRNRSRSNQKELVDERITLIDNDLKWMKSLQ